MKQMKNEAKINYSSVGFIYCWQLLNWKFDMIGMLIL